MSAAQRRNLSARLSGALSVRFADQRRSNPLAISKNGKRNSAGCSSAHARISDGCTSLLSVTRPLASRSGFVTSDWASLTVVPFALTYAGNPPKASNRASILPHGSPAAEVHPLRGLSNPAGVGIDGSSIWERSHCERPADTRTITSTEGTQTGLGLPWAPGRTASMTKRGGRWSRAVTRARAWSARQQGTRGGSSPRCEPQAPRRWPGCWEDRPE